MQVQDLDLGIWGPEMRLQAETASDPLDDDVDDKDDHYTIGDGAGDGDSDDDDHHHHYHHHPSPPPPSSSSSSWLEGDGDVDKLK